MKLSLPNGLNLKYGILEELHFSTIGEAFRSLYSQLPDFYEEVKHQLFVVKINGKVIDNELYLETLLPKDAHVELLTSIEGSGGGGVKMILGAVIAVAGAILTFTGFGTFLGGALIQLGLGLMAAGAAEMFAPKPPDKAEAAQNNLFQGQVAGTAEGSYLGMPVGIAKVTGYVIDQEIKIAGKQSDEHDFFWQKRETRNISFDVRYSERRTTSGYTPYATVYTASPLDNKYADVIFTYTKIYGWIPMTFSQKATKQFNANEKEELNVTIDLNAKKGTGTATRYQKVARYKYTHNVGVSYNRYNATFALGLGEIAGVNGRLTSRGIERDDVRKHVFFDDTPIMEKGGALNYKVSTVFRDGHKSQSVIDAAGWFEETYDANIELDKNDETAHSVIDSDVDELEAVVQLPQLYKTNDGKFYNNEVKLKVYQSINGGSYHFIRDIDIIDKEFSPFELKFLFQKPSNATNSWSIKIKRINDVSKDAESQNKMALKRWVQRKKEKYQHPYKVLVNLDFDSRDVASNSNISFEIAGAKMRIPNNYDPYVKSYSGLWNGGFSWSWSNNPAWILLHYLISPLAAGGCAKELSEFDLNSFYEAAKYCDQKVPNGIGGYEHRYELNGVIPGGLRADEVIKLVLSHFQANLILINGKHVLTIDKPEQAKYLLTNANVIDGFNYGSTSLKGQPNEIKVTYIEPSKAYEKSYLIMIDDELLAMQGRKITSEFELPLCHSAGMAQRLALFYFETNKSQVETVTYKASISHLVASGIGVMPGDVVHISDDFMIGHRCDGQFVKIEGKKITLDCEMDFYDGENYKLEYINAQNQWAVIDIDMVTTGEGLKSVIYTQSAISAVKGGIWIIVSNSLSPKPYKVVSIKQDEDDIVEVSCIAHNPNKYAKIEQGVNLPDKSYDDFITGAIRKPLNIIQKASLYKDESGTYGGIDFSFTEPNDARIKYYQAEVNRPNSGWQTVSLTGLNKGYIDKVIDGTYSIRVRSVAENNKFSAWTALSFKVNIWSPIPEDVKNFRATMQNENVLLEWDGVSDLDLEKYIICYSPIKGAYWIEAGEIAQTANTSIILPLRSGTYLIKAQDMVGGRSKAAAMVIVDGLIAKDENIIHQWSEKDEGWRGEGLFLFQNKLFLESNNNIFDWENISDVKSIFGECFNEGIYDFAEIIDLIEPMDVNLSAFIDARGRDLNDNIYEWGNIWEVENIYPYSDGSYGAYVEFRHSQDGIEWSGWQKLTYQKLKARYFEFRAVLWTEDTSYSPEIRDIHIIMDLPEYIQDGIDIEIPKEGLFISFQKAFWKLTSLTPTAELMTEGMNYRISQKSNEGFFIQFFDKNNTPIAAQIDYQAMGIGLKG